MSAILRLALSEMRNHAQLVLSVGEGAKIVALSGENGAGKTNILEALSLLAPGRGLRRASSDELFRRGGQGAGWGMAADVATVHGPVTIGTGSNPEKPAARRIVQIDGAAASQQDLPHYLAMIWLTPDMDRLLADAAGDRRRFLDRLVTGFDPAHAGRVSRYEQVMRERLRLLTEGRFDAAWCSALEDIMTTSGMAITAARQELVNRLNRIAAEAGQTPFPSVALALADPAAERLAGEPALAVEDWLRESLAEARRSDAASQMTSIGPHRADLLATHIDKNIPAALCSTGEQKALLIALILGYAKLVEAVRGHGPLLLLDDVTSHLDEKRRRALFDVLAHGSGQSWLTGTDDAIFAPLGSKASHFRVREGRAERLG